MAPRQFGDKIDSCCVPRGPQQLLVMLHLFMVSGCLLMASVQFGLLSGSAGQVPTLQAAPESQLHPRSFVERVSAVRSSDLSHSGYSGYSGYPSDYQRCAEQCVSLPRDQAPKQHSAHPADISVASGNPAANAGGTPAPASPEERWVL